MRSILVLILLAALAPPALAQVSAPPNARNVTRDKAVLRDTVTAGRLIVERPTLEAAGFEWMIEGDANRTAKVETFYRKKGEPGWRPALPMMRLENEHVVEDLSSTAPRIHPPVIDYTAPNAFAGSVFHLSPGTDYEFRFVLSDPDGVSGEREKTVSLRTRSEPMPASGHVYHVYPDGWKGPRQQPSFTGLMEAYYSGALGADFWNSYPPRVEPGDTILVHAGVYKDTAFPFYQGTRYGRTSYGLFFDGTYYLSANGTPDKPIVIKAAGDGEVVFDGNGAPVLFDLTKANYNYFEGITVRNAGIAFLLGRKRYWGADGFTLKHSRIEDVGRGVHDDWTSSKDFYIADNVFIGRHEGSRLVGRTQLWEKDPRYPPPINGPGGSEYAVKVYGQGHVIAYNKVTGWHDGIDIATYGNPDVATEEELPASIDFVGNDMSNFDDNCFEEDGGARNIRVYRNRCFNDAGTGLSVDPGFGGPFYAVENVFYNQVTGLGACGFECAGLQFFQNTVIGETSGGGAQTANIHFRNNLILASGARAGGEAGGGGGKPVFSVASETSYSSSDYNGFRPAPGVAAAFVWAQPPDGVTADFDPSHKTVKRSFADLKSYAAATGQDRHSVLVDYSDFVKVAPPGDDISRLYDPADFDFRLKPGSKAVGAGMVLPSINDGLAGRAPDLGALQSGEPLPHYGPRS